MRNDLLREYRARQVFEGVLKGRHNPHAPSNRGTWRPAPTHEPDCRVHAHLQLAQDEHVVTPGPLVPAREPLAGA